ncbi:MAG: sugar phosphate nucleotidyltransferase [Candidatus Hodarchaeota archaeon]
MGNKLSLLKNNFKEKLFFVILCAGEGVRLKEITKYTPKPLIKIERLNNVSILKHTIYNLINLEITQIAIVVGYLGDKISEYVSKLTRNNRFLQNKLIIIDTENQYKLGPLYSFLSITRNKSVFKPTNYYILIPGDTFFDLNILKKMLSIVSKNSLLIQEHPFVFYRKVKLKTLLVNFKGIQLISNAEVGGFGSNTILKRISQIKIRDIPPRDYVNQIIPIFVLNYDYISDILNIKDEIPVKTVWEMNNYMIGNGKKIFAFRISNKHNFYDIDNIDNLRELEKKKGQ